MYVAMIMQRLPRAAPWLLAALLFGVACRLAPAGRPLPTAATAPAFHLESTVGPLDVRAALAAGPLVLLFYRGHW
jgi:hypothetical protein